MKHLLALVALCCLWLTAQAQSKYSYTMYEEQTWLSRSGNDVWLVHLDLEWPRVLNDCVLPSLHGYLSEHLFGVQAATPIEALERLHDRTGQTLTQMPEGDKLTRHYLDCQLRMTSYQPDRYVSFFLKATESEGSGHAVRSDRRWLTYDIANDRVLTANDVFHESNMAGTYDETSRMVFETLIAQNAQCPESEMAGIDLRTLPLDFAVEGRMMRFGLGGRSDNYSNILIENLEQLSLLNRKFLKWYKGESRQKTAPATLATHPIAQQDYFTGADSVTFVPDQMPRYAEGNDSLYSFIVNHIQIPAAVQEMCLTGRIVISFIVEPDGTLSNFAVIRSLERSLDAAAVSAIRRAGRWQPGTKDGQPVRTRFTMPVVFRE